MQSRDTPLHTAAGAGDLITVENLLKENAEVNAIGNLGETPLHRAAYNNRSDVIELLIKYGANLEVQRNDGDKAIHVAAMVDAIDAVKAILKHSSVQIHTKGRESATALYRAAQNNSLKVVAELLTQHQDNPDQINASNRNSILHVGAIKNKPEIIALAHQHHATIDILDGNKLTPLQRAAMQNNPSLEAAKALIAAGADVNASNSNPTPLYLLATQTNLRSKNAKPFAELLIQKGANITAICNNETVLDALQITISEGTLAKEATALLNYLKTASAGVSQKPNKKI